MARDGVDDRVNIATGLDLIGRKQAGKPAPFACCPRDGEPLMSTFEFTGAEFYCQVCGGRFGFLSPTAKEPTPELQVRHDELRAVYDVERAQRQAARS